MSRCNEKGEEMRILGGKVPTFVSNYNGLKLAKAYKKWFKYVFSYFSDDFIREYEKQRPLSTGDKIRIPGGRDKN